MEVRMGMYLENEDVEDILLVRQIENGIERHRPYRGRIIFESDKIVRLQRRDGIWDIDRDLIVKIGRKTKLAQDIATGTVG
jgi:hypothetical protein